MGVAQVAFRVGVGFVGLWTLVLVWLMLFGGFWAGALLLPVSALLIPVTFGAWTFGHLAAMTFDTAGLARWEVATAGVIGAIAVSVLLLAFGFLLFEDETDAAGRAAYAVAVLFAASVTVTAALAWRRV